MRKLLLVDDAKTPFWDEWKQGWAQNFETPVEVCDFSTLQECLEKLEAKLQASPPVTGGRWYVVTDSMFGVEQGRGATLLAELRDREDLGVQWERAVIYSFDPRSEIDFGRDCRLLKRGVASEELDQSYITTFLETGRLCNLASSRPLRRELQALATICATLSARLTARHFDSSPLRPMVAYGVEAVDGPATCPVDEFVRFARDALLFSAESSELFGRFAEHDFLKGIGAFERGRGGPPSHHWQTITGLLDPAASLIAASSGGRSRLRLLWEIVHTGGDAALLQNHPYLETEWLHSYAKAAVRDRLERLAREIAHHSPTPNLARICAGATEELEQAARLLNQAEAGLRPLAPRDVEL